MRGNAGAAAAALIVALSVALPPAGLAEASGAEARVEVFDEVWQTVSDRFFDPDFNGADWSGLRGIYRPKAVEARTQAELSTVINDMLAELDTSHTRHFIPAEPAYYQLLGIFLPGNERLRRRLRRVGIDTEPRYSGIGIFTSTIGGHTFVSAVLDGGPAAAAGVLVGDRLIAAGGEPYHPIDSFVGKSGQRVALRVQRTANRASTRELSVVPKTFDAEEMFLDAMRASTEVVRRGDRRIGYIHVWSYAGHQFQRLLEHELLRGRLREADALVLDLRDGWGGASPGYLNIFTSHAVRMTMVARDGDETESLSGWDKPTVMLVNGNTRSGKEVLAYGFRKRGIGPIVGTTTAGALTAGSLFPMEDGSLLYLAVRDVRLDGMTRLEGAGVAPDIEVPFELAYAQGADPQKVRALDLAAELASAP